MSCPAERAALVRELAADPRPRAVGVAGTCWLWRAPGRTARSVHVAGFVGPSARAAPAVARGHRGSSVLPRYPDAGSRRPPRARLVTRTSTSACPSCRGSAPTTSLRK
ncbi:MAG: hypothetical protein MZU84_03955 [Sphingobacterium sp.]|nr:hypothetical protein [Sphingobacterium sp.]